MKHYQIDIWQDESIWSWAGQAESEDQAQELARLELNKDWDQEYETWDDLAADMDGTALLYDTLRERLHALREILKRLEWSSHRRGMGTGFMGSGGNGRMYTACPICGGLKEPNGDFHASAVGHSPTCELQKELEHG